MGLRLIKTANETWSECALDMGSTYSSRRRVVEKSMTTILLMVPEEFQAAMTLVMSGSY